jgi:hypothetical protein
MRTRSRLAVTFVFTLILAGFAIANVAEAAGRAEEHRDPVRFSADMLALHQAGWTLADYAEPDDRLEYTLVDATRTHAVRLVLGFDFDNGDGEIAVEDYRREAAAVPDEKRVYEQEASFFESLAHGAVARLEVDCGGYGLVLAGNEFAYLDSQSYHVVERSVRGKGAGAALTRELRGALTSGAHLAGLYQEDGVVRFHLVDDAESHTIETELDAAGQVVAIEVRRHPSRYAAGQLSSEPQLARALTRGQAVTRIATSEVEGVTKFELTLAPRKGKKSTRYVIDLADMVWEEEECGC